MQSTRAASSPHATNLIFNSSNSRQLGGYEHIYLTLDPANLTRGWSSQIPLGGDYRLHCVTRSLRIVISVKLWDWVAINYFSPIRLLTFEFTCLLTVLCYRLLKLFDGIFDFGCSFGAGSLAGKDINRISYSKKLKRKIRSRIKSAT